MVAILPNVTVEAASPVLIEKSRTAVSDGSGQYRVDQLRPGTYTVTFTLSGFSTFRREGVEISEGFTAPVNATLNVGAVKDTITVEAQAPVVDVQDVSEHRTLVTQELDALPTAQSFATLGTTLPSVAANQNDVGGSQGEKGNVLAAHGGNGFDMTLNVDGIAISNMGTTTNSGAAWSTFSLNPAAVQEMSFETDANSAESASGGVRVNVIPREGGNAFHGTFFANGANGAMARSNYDSGLKAQGLASPTGFDRLVDESAGFGGPILKDRLWFYYAERYRDNDSSTGVDFYSINPLHTTYNPNLSKPLHQGGFDFDDQIRLTSQLTPRNKVSIFYDHVNKCNCPTIAADSALHRRVVHPVDLSPRLAGVRELAGHHHPEAGLGIRHSLQPPRRLVFAHRFWDFPDVTYFHIRFCDLQDFESAVPRWFWPPSWSRPCFPWRRGLTSDPSSWGARLYDRSS